MIEAKRVMSLRASSFPARVPLASTPPPPRSLFRLSSSFHSPFSFLAFPFLPLLFHLEFTSPHLYTPYCSTLRSPHPFLSHRNLWLDQTSDACTGAPLAPISGISWRKQSSFSGTQQSSSPPSKITLDARNRRRLPDFKHFQQHRQNPQELPTPTPPAPPVPVLDTLAEEDN